MNDNNDSFSSTFKKTFTFDKSVTYYRNWCAFFLLGTINNLSYVVVNSSAQSLTDSFDSQTVSNLIGLVPAANVLAGVFARSLNTYLYDKVTTKGRVGANGLCMFAALGLLGIAATPGSIINHYSACLAFITVMGGTCSFGESAIVGRIREYPAELVDGWSSGTGMAGVLGSGLYLFFVLTFDLEAYQIYYLCLPTGLLYFLAYFVILLPPDEAERRSTYDDYTIQLNQDGESRSQESKWVQFQRSFGCVGWLAFNLFAVYFFEYVASVGAADRANDHEDTEAKFWTQQSYEILAFLYQVGVLISRSSLSFVKVKKVWVLTLLQGVNFVLWVTQATYRYLPLWFQFILMVYVGLLGGAAYVNICYIALNSNHIEEKDRELCVNIVMFSITFGIFGASAFTILMDETWLKDQN